MGVCLPLPSIKSERLEHSQRQNREACADYANGDCLFFSLFHTVGKNTINLQKNQTIRHISTIYPSFIRHSSHKPAEYPICLQERIWCRNFAIVIHDALQLTLFEIINFESMNRRTMIGIICIMAGLMMLFNLWNIIRFDWLCQQPWTAYIAPLLLLLIGVRLIISSFRHNRDRWLQRPIPLGEDGKRIRCSVSFGGDEYIYHGEPFHGARLEAYCGGIRLNLCEAVINEDEEIDIHTFMGGVELIVPSTVNVVVNSRSFIGGVGNETTAAVHRDTPCLHVIASNVLGGVSIKNED